jgi:glycosyltransferase involved in cell wall biosynthesis
MCPTTMGAPPPTKPPRLELWAPDYDPERGGVQAYSFFLRRALESRRPAGAVCCHAKWPAGRTAPLGTPGFAARLFLRGLLRPADLIISTHVNFAPVADALARVRRQHYVVAAHGIEVWGALSGARRRALVNATEVWAVSRHTRDRLLREHPLSPERVRVLPDTFEEDRFQPGPASPELRRRYRLPADAKVIFSVGRLASTERYKGFDRVITALPEIAKHHPPVHYLIAGRGDDQPRLEQLAASAGVRERVIFAGFVPTAELCAHYQLCDVFAMPSTGEGFGIVFLEAMACGKPVLAGNQDGSTEPLMDGQLGALVDPTEVPAIAAMLSDLLARRHPNRLFFDPAGLRGRVIGEFGFERFCARVRTALAAVLPAEFQSNA